MFDTQPQEHGSEPRASQPTWRQRVWSSLRLLGGEASLQALYQKVEEQYPEVRKRTHWKAKIRQVVQLDPIIERVGIGVWRLNEAKRPDAKKHS